MDISTVVPLSNGFNYSSTYCFFCADVLILHWVKARCWLVNSQATIWGWLQYFNSVQFNGAILAWETDVLHCQRKCRSNSKHRHTGTEHTCVRKLQTVLIIISPKPNSSIFQEDVFLRNLNKQTVAFESQSNQDNITQPWITVQLIETPCLVPECFAQPTITTIDLSKKSIISLWTTNISQSNHIHQI